MTKSPLSVFNGNNPLTMSSHEVADLTQSRHDNVKRTVERLAQAGVISLPPLEEVKIQRERRVETTTGYNLDKRSTMLVVGRLSLKFMARVFDRWEELESRLADESLDAELMVKMEAALLRTNPQWVLLMKLRAAGLEGRVIARAMGISRSSQERVVREIREAGLGYRLAPPARPPVGRKLATSADTRQMNLEV